MIPNITSPVNAVPELGLCNEIAEKTKNKPPSVKTQTHWENGNKNQVLYDNHENIVDTNQKYRHMPYDYSKLNVDYKKFYKSNERAIAEVNYIMENADADNNGTIDYSEFLVAMANKKQLLSKKNVKRAFDLFDSVYRIII